MGKFDIDRALVVGLGITGQAVVEVLAEMGVDVRASDARDTPALRETAARLRKLGVEVRLGGHDVSQVAWAEVVLPSKGVPPSNPIVSEAIAKGRIVWSEFELAWKLGARSLIAVTGTNGKTTTTALLSKILEEGGIENIPAGNLPVPLVRAVSVHGPDTLYVCEASSFGLAFIQEFRPFIGMVLNVGDDHYDWHSGYEDYLASKARITENQTESDLLIVNGDDGGCRSIAVTSLARLALFALDQPPQIVSKASNWSKRSASVVGGTSGEQIVVEKEGHRIVEIPVQDIRLQGSHNLENVLAALVAALEMGVELASIETTLRTFQGLPHRMTFVSEVRGVRYIDDSKATNPHATLSALNGLQRVVLIAGGQERGIDLSGFALVAPQLVGVVAMGESAERLESFFTESGVPVRIVADVEHAVRVAAEIAKEGETVLLSPAFSSWDQYSGYAERGERFAKAVMSL